MSRQNSQPALVTLIRTTVLHYCIYLQPLRDLTERLTRFDTLANAFSLGSSIVILPIVVLYEKIKLGRLLYGSVVLYHAASAFCKVAPNMNAFFTGQFFAGASAVSIIYGYNFLFSAINV
ncbi:unnamed protein product [Clonostachys rosea f. rosea IK726]|uniref:Uncharacterized protein n=1 Tax=Clonostachys rosea f. rosea IK726 TaxID=1349383 RepID=A0ACA9U0A0_BIOOC|nr:unnamed protein product [Clonostachys rosea f. rosea IK726]